MSSPKKKIRKIYSQDEAADHANSELKLEEVEAFCVPVDGLRDVWLNVFEKLNPEDKPAFSRALPQWHDWVAPLKPHVLLPEVAPIFMESLSQKTSLEARKINRFLTREFNHQYLEHPVRLYLPFEIPYKYDSFPRHISRFASTPALQTFMEEMENHPGNPFPWGNLELEWESPVGNIPQQELEQLYSDFCAIAMLLVTKFGFHVRYLRFSIPSAGNPLGTEILSKLRRLLLLVPNLKRLTIWGVFELTSEQFNSYFEQHPLPILSNLEGVDSLFSESSLISVVLNSCCLKTKLKRISIEYPEDEFGLPQIVTDFPNLEMLQAPFKYEDLIMLSSSQVEVPPLKRLEVTLLTKNLTFNEIFRNLIPYGKSLVHFMCTEMVVQKEWRELETLLEPNFPNLSSLNFTEYHGSLEPLLHFSKLTHLTILNNYSLEPRCGVVDFLGFEERMYESNIWGMIPSLQKLVLQGHKYDRYTYERIRGGHISVAGKQMRAQVKIIKLDDS